MHSIKPQSITLLGATGSIGHSTLDVLARHPERFRVYALTAHRQIDALAALCRQWRPAVAVVGSQADAQRLMAMLSESAPETAVRYGADALADVAQAPEVDTVMAAIVGAAGLLPTLAAVRAGKRVLLANKEALVMSGAIFMEAVAEHGATLLPIDSEHNAIFQCLPNGVPVSLAAAGIDSLILTASGGPFLQASAEQLAQVTPAQAVKHPNWNMGQKISVDSATLMNKGLELIEACWLFAAHPDQVEIVMHPQSVIHSMVRYADGSVLAQMGQPDMRTPIAHALAWPERMSSGVAPLDFTTLGDLSFLPPDIERFPCLRLAREAIAAGGTWPCVLNAANEIAVAAFLAEELAFQDIPVVIEAVMQQMPVRPASELATILSADQEARARATQYIASLPHHARD
ncbi:MAG: 1-deoxy-D-xylulose-5-phosphate reductoisomerase [Paraperlucidibaca sp.]